MREENNRLREETLSLQQQASQMAQLAAENQRLSNLLAHAGSAQPPKPEQLGELLRLRGEATRLRANAQADAKAANPMVEMAQEPGRQRDDEGEHAGYEPERRQELCEALC